MSRYYTIRLCNAVLCGQSALLQAIEVITGKEYQFNNLGIKLNSDDSVLVSSKNKNIRHYRPITYRGGVSNPGYQDASAQSFDVNVTLPLVLDAIGWKVSDHHYAVIEIEKYTGLGNSPKERYLVWWEYPGFWTGRPFSVVRAVRIPEDAKLGESASGNIGSSRHDRQEDILLISKEREYLPSL